MTTRLLVDAGNTRLKWAVVEGDTWHAQGVADYADCSRFDAALEQVGECFIASVAGCERSQHLADLLSRAGVVATWLASEAAYGDLSNGYEAPEKLGVDRWMGLVAARARTREAVLVVSAGTALTVDALSGDGRFLGGIIVPGVALMREALRLGTAGVAPSAGAVQAFPRTTADAVCSGAIAALCGAVRQQFAHLAAHAGQTPRCIVTGGSAAELAPHLALSFEIVPTLVLEGIDRVARERGA